MKTQHDRLSRPYGALVEYGQFAGRRVKFESAAKWSSALRRYGLSARAIQLSQPYAPLFVYAPTSHEQTRARLTLDFERIDPEKYDGLTFDHRDTARVAQREGFWCYHYWEFNDLDLGSVPAEDVLALVAFQATDDQLPAILTALSAHGYGENQWPGLNVPVFEDIAWGDTLKTMKRAA